MATDALLVRLRELLESIVTHSDTAIRAIRCILDRPSAQDDLRKWWRKDGFGKAKAAATAGMAIRRSLVNTADICEGLGLLGDAGFLRSARTQLLKCSSQFNTNIKAIKKRSTANWEKAQAGLWERYMEAMLEAHDVARFVLNSRLFHVAEQATDSEDDSRQALSITPQSKASIGLFRPADKQINLPEVDLKLSQVRYAGKCHNVTPDGALMMSKAIEAFPDWYCASEFFSKPGDIKKSLPDALYELVETSRGKGYRLNLS